MALLVLAPPTPKPGPLCPLPISALQRQGSLILGDLSSVFPGITFPWQLSACSLILFDCCSYSHKIWTPVEGGPTSTQGTPETPQTGLHSGVFQEPWEGQVWEHRLVRHLMPGFL